MKNTKNDFKKFTKRAKNSAISKTKSTKSAKKSQKELARAELMRAVRESNVGCEGAKIKISDDHGFRGRGGYSGKSVYATGIFSQTARGFGFVSTEDTERDIFIPEGYTLDALEGDEVEIVYKKFKNAYGEEKTEGRILGVTMPARQDIIGCVMRDSYMRRSHTHTLYVMADDLKFGRKFYIENPEEATVGDKVMAKIIRSDGKFYCRIKANFGNALSKEANYESILSEFGIEREFSDNELYEAEAAAGVAVDTSDRQVQEGIIFTIDSESAKDLDDAVSIERTAEGWCLGVHIADVCHYVKEKSALERLAMRRGNSVYFTDKVVPMLPGALSNGACSLNPGEEKYTLTAKIRLDKDGSIISASVVPSVIVSRIKGIYKEINRILDGDATEELLEKYGECLPSIFEMRELYRTLYEKNRRRGAIDLDSEECEIILDDSGAPIDIVPRQRGVSERMIEQFMLTANEAVATLLYEKQIPCVYRIHKSPDPDKMRAFIDFAHALDFDASFINADACRGQDIGRLLDAAKERGNFDVLSYACLRSLSKAEYSATKEPHFGLGIDNYCHFTSPIRRLSDLATHRIIKEVLIGGGAAKKYEAYAKRAAAAATDGELRAVGAERRIEDLYKAIYMSAHIGEEYAGRVSSATAFGIFVRLENGCEGLVPISEMGGMFFYDEKTHTVRGARLAYRPGDTVNIRVEEADIQKGKLRFSLTE